MTKIQENKLMRALELLVASGLVAEAIHTPSNTFYRVLARGETRKAGKPRYHMVYRSQETRKFVCKCIHGEKEGNVCVHKAAAFVCENGGDIEKCRRIAQQQEAAAKPAAQPVKAAPARSVETFRNAPEMSIYRV